MEKKTWFSVQTEIIQRGKLKRKLLVLMFAMALSSVQHFATLGPSQLIWLRYNKLFQGWYPMLTDHCLGPVLW